jgi:hypothetical protein
MRFLLRLLGTSHIDADRAIAAMDRITNIDLRDYAFGAFALTVAIIDLSLYAYIVSGAQ